MYSRVIPQYIRLFVIAFIQCILLIKYFMIVYLNHGAFLRVSRLAGIFPSKFHQCGTEYPQAVVVSVIPVSIYRINANLRPHLRSHMPHFHM